MTYSVEKPEIESAQISFRRMVFNILVDNIDDHESTHGFVHDGGSRLSKAFDISPQMTRLGYQQMQVGTEETESSLKNALSACERFGLRRDEAVVVVEGLVEATRDMADIHRDAGIEPARIEAAEQYRRKLVEEFEKTKAAVSEQARPGAG